MSPRSATVDWLMSLSRLPCAVHTMHRPSIKRADGRYTVESHHILPQEYGGKDTFVEGPTTVTNRVSVCPTGHVSIHELLRVLIDHDGEAPYAVKRHYSVKEQTLAQEGYRRWVVSGRTASTDGPVIPGGDPSKG